MKKTFKILIIAFLLAIYICTCMFYYKGQEVSSALIEEMTVIPVGQVSGLKLYTSSSLVVGMSQIRGEDQKMYKPYENCELKEGDRILKIDDIEITDTNTLIQIVNNSAGKELEIEFERNGKTKKCKITPVKAQDGTYKLGLWVRDSAAGLGTLTFYEPKTRKFCCIRTWNNRY